MNCDANGLCQQPLDQPRKLEVWQLAATCAAVFVCKYPLMPHPRYYLNALVKLWLQPSLRLSYFTSASAYATTVSSANIITNNWSESKLRLFELFWKIMTRLEVSDSPCSAYTCPLRTKPAFAQKSQTGSKTKNICSVIESLKTPKLLGNVLHQLEASDTIFTLCYFDWGFILWAPIKSCVQAARGMPFPLRALRPPAWTRSWV